MLEWLKKMHEDGEGNPSNMRVCVSLAVVSGIVHSFVFPEYSMYSHVLVATALGCKSWQSSSENRK